MHEIINALRDVFAETWFILMTLAIGMLAVWVGDKIADRREADARQRKAEISNSAARHARIQAAKNDAEWAKKFGNTR